MYHFVARRLLWAVGVVFAVVTTTFFIAHLVPANPARAAAGLHAGAAQVEATTRALGLNRPLGVQYLIYLRGLLHGDLGISYATGEPLTPQLLKFLPATLELVLWSFTIYVLVGVAAGVLWAAKRGRLTGALIRSATGLGVAMPVFWLALMLQLWFGSKLGWLPINGRFDQYATPPPHITGLYTFDSLIEGRFGDFVDAAQHLVLPVAALVVWMFAISARITEKSVTDELDRPYVRTARAKGARRWRVLLHHVLRNALNPVLSMLGLQFGWLLGGTILVEVIFSWPGIGLYMYTALQTFDYPVITAVTIVITTAFVLANLVVDLLYPVLDPRIRRA